MSGEVAGMLHDFGDGWQIQHDEATGVWTAVQYPTPTASRVLVGRDAADLLGKLQAASGREPRPALRSPEEGVGTDEILRRLRAKLSGGGDADLDDA